MIARSTSFVFFGCLLVAATSWGQVSAQGDAAESGRVARGQRVLILSDQNASGAGDLAGLHAVMLANLLGRWPDLSVEIRPLEDYGRGDADDYLRVFYLGSVYGRAVPDGLVQDVVAGAPVTWVNYGVWALDRPQAGATLSRLGLEYVALHSASRPEAYEASFREVTYRGHPFRKAAAPMEMVELRAGPDVLVHAWAADGEGRRIPYALQSGAFWYVADLPFTYLHETDRYLVFADLLGPMLGRAEACEARAVVRIEDVDPNDEPDSLGRAVDLLSRLGVPFAAAVIPRYVSNPAARAGQAEARVDWGDRPELLDQLLRIPSLGGRVFQHGTTHQVEGYDNPAGVSGVDWEFWDPAGERPVPSLTADAALERVRDGRRLLEEQGLEVAGWVTPHYAFDTAMGEGLTEIHPVVFERRPYAFDGRIGGQFFPYPVRDAYGARVVPENGGSIQAERGIPEILAAARANRALRCPWFGFFFHPEILDPGFDGEHATGVDDLAGLIGRIRAMGFRFVDPAEAGATPDRR